MIARSRIHLSQSQSLLLGQRASQMRARPTASEAALWRLLRKRLLGVEFRRQVVVGARIVDFLAPAPRLVVEVDGGWHDQRVAADAARDGVLRRRGLRILRVRAEEVLRDPAGIVAQIREALG